MLALIVLIVVAVLVGGWRLRQQRLLERAQAEASRLERLQAEKAAEAARLAEAQRETDRLAREAAAERARAERIKAKVRALRAHYELPDVGIVEGLSLLAWNQNQAIAVDPEVISVLEGLVLRQEEFGSFANRAVRERCVARRGLVLHSVPVLGSVEVLTTRAIRDYCQSVQFLRARRLPEAMACLNGVTADCTGFGDHCRALHRVLEQMRKEQVESGQLASTARTRLREAKWSHTEYLAKERGVLLVLKGKDGKVGGDASVLIASAKFHFGKTMEHLEAVCLAMNDYLQRSEEYRRTLAERFWTAYGASLYTEAAFLLDEYTKTLTSLRQLYDEIEKTGLLSGWALPDYLGYGKANPIAKLVSSVQAFRQNLSEMPRELQDIRVRLAENLQKSNGYAEAFKPDDASHAEILRSLESSSRALLLDRGSMATRSAAGYFRMRLQAFAMRDVMTGGADDGTRMREVLRWLEINQKSALLAAAAEQEGPSNLAELPGWADARIGVSRWLRYSQAAGNEGKSECMPVVVQIKAAGGTGSGRLEGEDATGAGYSGLWRSWSVRERSGYSPVSSSSLVIFEDHGTRDLHMQRQAIECARWIQSKYADRFDKKAAYITFHDMEGPKQGADAGLAMATAICSAIENRPVSSSVTMTGTILNNGDVLPVADIFEKVLSASLTPGIELIIIPAGNEGDARMIPVDTLCRTTIVAVKDVAACIDYATRPEHNAKALAKLRKAQLRLLAGKRDVAQDLLLEVAAECPDLFTARRLLEVLSFWKNVEGKSSAVAAADQGGFSLSDAALARR